MSHLRGGRCVPAAGSGVARVDPARPSALQLTHMVWWSAGFEHDRPVPHPGRATPRHRCPPAAASGRIRPPGSTELGIRLARRRRTAVHDLGDRSCSRRAADLAELDAARTTDGCGRRGSPATRQPTTQVHLRRSPRAARPPASSPRATMDRPHTATASRRAARGSAVRTAPLQNNSARSRAGSCLTGR